MTLRRISGMPDHVVDTPFLVEGIDTASTIIETHTIGLFDRSASARPPPPNGSPRTSRSRR